MKNKIYVQNLKCGGCANTITNKLTRDRSMFQNVTVNVEESVNYHLKLY